MASKKEKHIKIMYIQDFFLIFQMRMSMKIRKSDDILQIKR